MADQSMEQLIEDLRRKDEAEKLAQGQVESGSMVPPLDPKNVLSSALKQQAALQAQRSALIDQMAKDEAAATEEFKKTVAPTQMPMSEKKADGTTVSLPQTYAALEQGQNRLSDLEKKMVVPKAEPDRLAEVLLAAIPTLLGVGIGAATKRPGMAAAGLAAGGAGATAGLKELKEGAEKQRAAQIKAAEERLQRQTTLEKSYLDAVAKAETYPYEAQLIAAKSASPELAKEALEKQRANTKYLMDRTENKAVKARLQGVDNQLKALEDLIKQQTEPPKQKGPAKAKEPTASQFAAAGFVRRMEQAEAVFADLEKSGYQRESTMESVRNALGEIIPQARSEQGGMSRQAEKNFLTAALRRESGAAISKDEFATGEAQYFDRPGDTPKIKEQKRANRLQVIESLKAEAGEAYKRIPSVSVGTTPPAGGGSAAAELEKVRKEREELERKLSKGKK